MIGTTSAFAQEAATPPPHGGMMQDNMAGMGNQSTKMLAMREKMMADMKGNDAKMDLKVAAMNAAEGMAKTDAIPAVINEIVSRQKRMTANMETMYKQMMDNMAPPDAPMKGTDMGKPPAGSPK